MDIATKLLSEAVWHRTYAKYLASLKRREIVEETINRSHMMDLERFPQISGALTKAYDQVHDLKVAPSMRKLQFAGPAIAANNAKSYNCSYLPIDDIRAFGETLFLLLAGTGVGYSVQSHHVSKLPAVRKPVEECKYVIPDNIIGWGEALDRLIEAYFLGRTRPIFDFSRIRPKGELLLTSGGKAPGPEPLRQMLVQVESMLRAAVGRKLRPLEAHDILCVVSDCVLSGGSRRSAMISLFDRDDREMLECKNKANYDGGKKNTFRCRSNNSAVMPRSLVTREEFDHVYDMCIASGFGEPGLFWTDDIDWGTNPCCEVSLEANQFCNLSTVNLTSVKTEKDFLSRVYSAALLGTVQASYTNFPFLRDVWRETTERGALIGVSFTGIADCPIELSPELLRKGAELVKEVNAKYAKKIGIREADRCTVIKPEGTSSTVFGSSSGVHARYSEYYVRSVQMNRDTSVAHFLQANVPELVRDSFWNKNDVVLSIPQNAPAGSITWDKETALDLFLRAIKFDENWIAHGHRRGANKNNVSCTLEMRDREWELLRNPIWENRYNYTGISMFPRFAGAEQSPFQECSKEKYEELLVHVKELDFSKLIEEDDEGKMNEAAACAGGACEISKI
jgi:ribonucleoside-diphosphate reductase alpha chain